MTRFLFATLPTDDLGLLTRSIPIATELAQHGHEVVFCSPARAPRRLVAEAGFANPLPGHPIFDLIAGDQSVAWLARFIVSGRWRRRYGNGTLTTFLRDLVAALPIKSAPHTPEIWDADHAGAVMGMLNAGFVRANCRALTALIVESGAEVVVDFWNPFAVIAARALGKPVISVIQANAHPSSQGFVWWKSRPATIPTPVPVVNKILAEYGLPPVSTLGELSMGELTLVVGTPETDPLPESAAVTYIGAILWQKPGASLPNWITDLDRDRPLVWVYSGNPRYAVAGDTLDSEVVIRASIAALADEDVQVVLTTGHHPLPKGVFPLPANVRHEPYVPGLVMAERSDVLIHHGGYGSCQTGLFAGKPAVIIPTFSERESNARRIAALGAGVIVPAVQVGRKKRVDTEALRAAVRRLLTDASFADNARQAGERLRAYGGVAQAARLIEDFTRGQGKEVRAVPGGSGHI
jgi:UDP:flavonoid glycosyltransferase YjiC (YdhE family)